MYRYGKITKRLNHFNFFCIPIIMRKFHWARAALFSLSILDRVQMCLCSLVGDKLCPTLQSLSHIPNITSLLLLYCYSHEKNSDKLHPLVPSIQTFTTKTHHTMYTGANHPHSLPIALVRRRFHLDSFFPRIVIIEASF